MSTVDAEVDDLAQYGRRENIVFTNLLIDEHHDVPSQVVQLCKEIGVTVEPSDLVDAHPLPAAQDKPKRYIARFHQRSTAKQVFSNRRKAKDITGDCKGQLAHNAEKGFGILPNLTPKRGKLFGQVKEFCDSNGHLGCWADTNTGKILLKLQGETRGRVIRNTGDLVAIKGSYNPDVWYFCTPPLFHEFVDDLTPPCKIANPGNGGFFSPSEPAPVRQAQSSYRGDRGHRGGDRGHRGNYGSGYTYRGDYRGAFGSYRPY